MKKIVIVFLLGLLVKKINAQTPNIPADKHVTITQNNGTVEQVGNLSTNSTTQSTAVTKIEGTKLPKAVNGKGQAYVPINKFDGGPPPPTSPPPVAVIANNQSNVNLPGKKGVENLTSNSTKVASAAHNNETVTPTKSVENLALTPTKVASAAQNNATVTATKTDGKPIAPSIASPQSNGTLAANKDEKSTRPPTKVLTDKVTDSKPDVKTDEPLPGNDTSASSSTNTSTTITNSSSKSTSNSTSAPKEEPNEKNKPDVKTEEPSPGNDTSASSSTNTSTTIASSSSKSTSAPKEEPNEKTKPEDEKTTGTTPAEGTSASSSTNDNTTSGSSGTESASSSTNPQKEEPDQTPAEHVEIEDPPLTGVEGSEESSSSNFPVMFLLSILAIVGGYFLYHNKSKLLGLIIEGRVKSPRSSPRYNRLRNVEEAMPGMRSTKNV